MTPLTVRPAVLVGATFVALSLGFVAGYWVGKDAPAAAGTGPSATGAPHPVGPDQYLELGMQALGAGNFAEAERSFRAAASLAPESAEVRTDLAVALLYQGRWEEAGAEVEAAQGIDPELPEVWFLEGVIQRDGVGDLAAARAAWERFLTLVPGDSPQATTVRAWLAELDQGGPAPAPGALPGAGDSAVVGPGGAR